MDANVLNAAIRDKWQQAINTGHDGLLDVFDQLLISEIYGVASVLPEYAWLDMLDWFFLVASEAYELRYAIAERMTLSDYYRPTSSLVAGLLTALENLPKSMTAAFPNVVEAKMYFADSVASACACSGFRDYYP